MRHTKRRSYIKLKEVKKDYAGKEASPYWEDVEEKGDYNQDHGAKEVKEANPDVLPESAGLYYQEPVEDPRLQQIKCVWDKLSPQEQQVLQMVGYEGRSLSNCAVKMGVSVSSVRTMLNRVKVKIKRCHPK